MLQLAHHNSKINQRIEEIKMMRCLEECRKQLRPKQGKPGQQKQREEKQKEKGKKQEEKEQKKGK